MLRLIGGAVVGYLVMAVALFVALTAAYLAMGADLAFRAGVYDVSVLWVVTNILVGFGAALLGGWVARRVGVTVSAPRALAGLVVVLGLAMALPALWGEAAAPAVRDAALGPFDAMMQAQTPLWMMLLNPIIGAVGVLVGGRALGVARDRTPGPGAAVIADHAT